MQAIKKSTHFIEALHLIFIVGTFKSTIAAFSFLKKYCGKMASLCMIVFVDKSESEG